MLLRLALLAAGTPENNGAAEWGLAGVAFAGVAGCLYFALREALSAWTSIKTSQPYWEPPLNEDRLIGPGAGAPFPLNAEEISQAKAIYSALDASGLFKSSDDDRIAFLQELEREGAGEICALFVVQNTYYALKSIDQPMPGWVFTDEQVECFDTDIQAVVQKLLALAGEAVRPDEIVISRDRALPKARTQTGTVTVPISGETRIVPVAFHPKYTPEGLIDGVVKHLRVSADQRFFWENLDFHVAIIRAKPEQVEVFNAAMEALDDSFRFYPFVADETL
ncbi:MAG: hypothetical protein AAFX86_06770 [Pseudomonadota bacterium]